MLLNTLKHTLKNLSLTTLVFFLVVIVGRGQGVADQRKKLSLKVSPFALLSSTADVAVGYYAGNQYAFEFKYGKRLAFKDVGFKTMLEIQRYVHPRLMVALEWGFSTVSNDDSVNYFERNSTEGIDLTNPISDDFSFRLKRYSVTPKIIWIMHSARHFQIEGFAGIGWKRVQRTVSELEFDAARHVDLVEYEGLFEGANYPGSSWTSARVALGMNFCYLIYR